MVSYTTFGGVRVSPWPARCFKPRCRSLRDERAEAEVMSSGELGVVCPCARSWGQIKGEREFQLVLV
jgi:hypothetical protein